MSDSDKGMLSFYHSTGGEDLRYLAKDIRPIVRQNVAKNPNTLLDTLLELAGDVEAIVRWSVARNTRASGKILIKIFEYEKSLKEPTGGVIRALYRHKNLPLVAKVIIETLFGEMLT